MVLFQVLWTSNIKEGHSKNIYTLEIKEASAGDSGKYTIKAKNIHGQCSATASLNVLGKVFLDEFLDYADND